MTKEEYRLKGIKAAIASLLLPFAGVAAFYIKPLTPIAPALFYGGPFVLVALFAAFKIRESRIPWQKYHCPYCGETFEAEPVDGTVKHLPCGNQVYIRGKKAV